MYTNESIAPTDIITSERKEADNAQQLSGDVTASCQVPQPHPRQLSLLSSFSPHPH